jgi:hypothetical protein
MPAISMALWLLGTLTGPSALTTCMLGLPGNAAARSLSSVSCDAVLDNSRALAALRSGRWLRLSPCVSLFFETSLFLLLRMESGSAPA